MDQYISQTEHTCINETHIMKYDSAVPKFLCDPILATKPSSDF